jgi:hypothetical protein
MAKPHRKRGVCINATEFVSVAIKWSSRLGSQATWHVSDDLTDKPVIFAISI